MRIYWKVALPLYAGMTLIAFLCLLGLELTEVWSVSTAPWPIWWLAEAEFGNAVSDGATEWQASVYAVYTISALLGVLIYSLLIFFKGLSEIDQVKMDEIGRGKLIGGACFFGLSYIYMFIVSPDRSDNDFYTERFVGSITYIPIHLLLSYVFIFSVAAAKYLMGERDA